MPSNASAYLDAFPDHLERIPTKARGRKRHDYHVGTAQEQEYAAYRSVRLLMEKEGGKWTSVSRMIPRTCTQASTVK
jgi:hypothetical protein